MVPIAGGKEFERLTLEIAVQSQRERLTAEAETVVPFLQNEQVKGTGPLKVFNQSRERL